MLGVWRKPLKVTPMSLLPPCKASRARGTGKRLFSDVDQLVTFLMLEPAE
jgi:hypothetical protein